MYKIELKSRIVNGRRKTTAIIFNESGGYRCGAGTVHQFIGDKDVKVIGQKYALEKALAGLSFEKNERVEIWKQFFNRSKAAKKLRR
jgi:hypothetical protein